MRCARRLSELRSSSVSGGTADGGKEHEGYAPSNSAAGESHLHHGKQVCRLLKYYGAGALHLPRSNCVSWACIARNTPPERSNPLSGENLIHQVRELRRNPLRSCAVPVGSRNFVPRPSAVEPPTGGKNMRAPRPHTPRQVRSPAPRQTEFAVMKVQMMFYRQSQYFSIKKFFSD